MNSINTNSEFPKSLNILGIIIIIMVTLMILLVGWIFTYPDIVEAKVLLTSKSPAIPVYSTQSTTIESIYIENGDSVKIGDPVLQLYSLTNKQDVDSLEYLLKHYQNNITDELRLLENTTLGEIQPLYLKLVQLVSEYNQFNLTSDTQLNINSLEGEIAYIKKYNKSIYRQDRLLRDEIQLFNSNFERYQKLEDKGVISKEVLDLEEIKLLQKKQNKEKSGSVIITNKIRIQQLTAQIKKIDIDFLKNKNDRIFIIEEQISLILNEINKWRRKYIIKSPINGTIAFNNIWSEQQVVEIETPLFIVSPFDFEGNNLARFQIPIINSGKISIGNKVNISLDAYPSYEYGFISTELISISNTPSISKDFIGYIGESSLPDSLITNYGIEIPMQQNMTGSAKIITSKKSFIQRLFVNIYDKIKN